MKYIMITCLISFTIIGTAQNVGIGITNPAEKLDVNGNVNITGTIKAAGVAGSSGQVLMSTGTGLSWGSSQNYKKCVMFTTPGSSTWPVPAGVTEVMVEVWGGGSGGTQYCGGSSGGYARSVQAVTPGYVVSYTVGAGSIQGTTSSSDAGNSQITLPLGFLSASGGGGVASLNSRGQVYSGTTSLANYFFMHGNMGEPTTSTYGQRSSTIYGEWKHYGAGGAPVGMLNSTSVKGDVLYYENGSFISYVNSIASKLPSAGGAAGSGSGWFGANGMVIIWFN